MHGYVVVQFDPAKKFIPPKAVQLASDVVILQVPSAKQQAPAQTVTFGSVQSVL
jgi:hypothetical protein